MIAPETDRQLRGGITEVSHLKKTIAFLLSLALVIGLFGVQIFADGAEGPKQTLKVSTEPGKMTVTLEGQFGEKDWVGIYKAGETYDPDNGGIASLVWWYVGENGCEVELPATEGVSFNRYEEFILDGNIIPAEYEVVVFANDGYLPLEGCPGKYVTVKSSVIEDEDVEKAPSDILFLNTDDYDSLFLPGAHDIGDIYFDSDKQCYIAEVVDSTDPHVELNFDGMITFEELKALTTEDAKVISIGVKIDPEAGNELEFYYQTEAFPFYCEPQKVIAGYANTDGYQYVNIDLRQAPYREGALLNCRYDIFRSSNKDSEVEIYYIGFFKSMAGAEEFGRAWLEKGGGSNNPLAPEPPVSTTGPDVTATQEAAETPTAIPEATPTDAPEATPEPTPTEKPADSETQQGSSAKKGCGGILYSGFGAVAAAAALVLIKKKR